MAEPALQIELIVWHHKRRTARAPYSAAAYLIDPSKPQNRQLIEAGNCSEAGTEGEAARDALRALQTALGDGEGAWGELVRRALLDPVGAVTERRTVG